MNCYEANILITVCRQKLCEAKAYFCYFVKIADNTVA